MSFQPRRDYPRLLSILDPSGDREQRMRSVVDALWPELSTKGVSWLGFYLLAHDPERGQEMILGPRRDKPACSPIGMHGACGRCARSGRALIVRDVAALGAGYIACDPRDQSEVVLPLFEPATPSGPARCWGVFDVDSFDVGAFTQDDVAGLQQVLEHSGLTTYQDWHARTDSV
jgi:putative methionine-R-sulfoxide reductase with GAF domain